MEIKGKILNFRFSYALLCSGFRKGEKCTSIKKEV